MTKLEKRGDRFLIKPIEPPKPVKKPVAVFVHYTNQANERVAFELHGLSATRRASMANNAKWQHNVTDYVVRDHLEIEARLIQLPSEKTK